MNKDSRGIKLSTVAWAVLLMAISASFTTVKAESVSTLTVVYQDDVK